MNQQFLLAKLYAFGFNKQALAIVNLKYRKE